ncbi:hypothetical protein C8J57DRAFT_1529207 [Mycena rebaudengoi]|nr:hypothetical protein C8J57DRAFT_1529207 [Mycena rebaudengoi]
MINAMAPLLASSSITTSLRAVQSLPCRRRSAPRGRARFHARSWRQRKRTLSSSTRPPPTPMSPSITACCAAVSVVPRVIHPPASSHPTPPPPLRSTHPQIT